MDLRHYGPLSGGNSYELDLIRCQIDKTPIREVNFSTEVFNHLKKNYEDRIASLEFQFKQALNLVEHDELLNTMKRNQTTDEFRKQRIFELLEESLLSEMESTIDRLTQTNALLKAELSKISDDTQRQNVQNENEILKSNVEKLDAALKRHELLALQFGQEREQLHLKLRQTTEHYDHQIRNNDTSYSQNLQTLHTEVRRLNNHIQDLHNLNVDLENVKVSQDGIIQDMKNDIEVLKAEYSKTDKSFQNLTSEHSAILKNIANLKVTNSKLEEEIERLQVRNQECQKELERKNADMKKMQLEKEELTTQIENLRVQTKKDVENEQKTLHVKVKELKGKYKIKIKGLKEKLNELKISTETLLGENQTPQAHFR